MKIRGMVSLAAVVAAGAMASAGGEPSNVDPNNKYAWGENVGFLNWRDANGTADGVRLENDQLMGFIWGENIGWINCGNRMGDAFGVQVDSVTGEMSGFAWGENVGWINFGTTPSAGSDGARYDDSAGRFRGYAWGENIGWINLDDSQVFVAVVSCPSDYNGDGTVNAADLGSLLNDWGPNPGSPADITGDGVVNAADLANLLNDWGPC